MDRIAPLLDRGMIPIVISQEPRWLLNYVLHLVVDGKMRLHGGTKGDWLNLREANEVIEYFTTRAWRLPTISVRTLERVAVMRRLCPDDWRDIPDAKLLPAPICEASLPPTPVINPRKFDKAA